MLTFRVGGLPDADAVAPVWTAANLARAAAAGLPPAAGSPADRIRRLLSGPATVLVVAEDGDPVAMALIVQARTDGSPGADPVPGLAHVTMVAVHPSRWGHGLGGAVLSRALTEAHALGYTEAQLWTQATNHRAQRLYERLGWTASGRTTTDEDGEHIRHYTVDLAPPATG